MLPVHVDPMREANAQRDRLVTPAFVALAVAELAYFLAAGMAIPLTPRFATGPLGADALGSGIAYGAFGVTALLLRPFAGRLSDRGTARAAFADRRPMQPAVADPDQ